MYYQAKILKTWEQFSTYSTTNTYKLGKIDETISGGRAEKYSSPSNIFHKSLNCYRITTKDKWQ